MNAPSRVVHIFNAPAQFFNRFFMIKKTCSNNLLVDTYCPTVIRNIINLFWIESETIKHI